MSGPHLIESLTLLRNLNTGAAVAMGGGPDPDPDPDPPYDADLGAIGNRPPVLVAPTAVDTGPRVEPTGPTMTAAEALAAVLATPVSGDGLRYISDKRIAAGFNFNNPATHHSIVFEDCDIGAPTVGASSPLYAVNSINLTGALGAPMPEFRFCRIRGARSTVAHGGNVRYLRCEMSHGFDIAKPFGQGGEFYACYMHGTWWEDGAHTDVFQIVNGAAGLLVHWCNISAYNTPDSPAGGGAPSSGALQTGGVTADIGPVYWHDNWWDGGGYTIRNDNRSEHTVTYEFKRNKVGRGGTFGALYGQFNDINFDDSNVWADTSLPVRGDLAPTSLGIGVTAAAAREAATFYGDPGLAAIIPAEHTPAALAAMRAAADPEEIS